jgi:hypothetical protein
MTDVTTWTSEELGRIEAAQELEIAPQRRDGITNDQARSTTCRLVPRADSAMTRCRSDRDEGGRMPIELVA